MCGELGQGRIEALEVFTQGVDRAKSRMFCRLLEEQQGWCFTTTTLAGVPLTNTGDLAHPVGCLDPEGRTAIATA